MREVKIVSWLRNLDEKIVSSFLSSFADDTRVSRGVADVADASALQQDLEVVYQWAETTICSSTT